MKEVVEMISGRFCIPLSIFIGTILSGCGLSQVEVQATATQLAAEIFATQTAQSPTVTPTFTPSPTPTATPTLTPTPTNTPTITPTPTPPLMAVVFTLDDLPVGFQAMPGEVLSGMQMSMPVDAIVFGFWEEMGSQFVMGYLVPYPTRSGQIAFDNMSTEGVDSFPAAFGSDSTPEYLPNLDDIGESRAGITFVTEAVNLSLRWDIVVFRQGETGVFLFVAYPDGDKPAVPVGDLARQLDERLSKFIGSIP